MTDCLYIERRRRRLHSKEVRVAGVNSVLPERDNTPRDDSVEYSPWIVESLIQSRSLLRFSRKRAPISNSSIRVLLKRRRGYPVVDDFDDGTEENDDGSRRKNRDGKWRA